MQLLGDLTDNERVHELRQTFLRSTLKYDEMIL